MYIHLL
ncbi:hypothetical protein VCHENC02_1144, partial [Vibrio harveyi]